MNIDTRYSYLRIDIKKVENVNIAVNNDLDGTLGCIDDIEDLEECKSALLDLMVNTREQMNVLKEATDELYGFANDMILNTRLKPSEHIKVHSDAEFKKALINHRY